MNNLSRIKNRILQVYVCLMVVVPVYGQSEPEGWDDFLHAIGTVESNHDDSAVGDGGASIGRYQIQRAYWIDATQYDKTIGGKYEDVRDPAYAERVIKAYMRRYARQAYQDGDWQTMARIHNGGPRGHRKQATLPYWNKVKAELER